MKTSKITNVETGLPGRPKAALSAAAAEDRGHPRLHGDFFEVQGEAGLFHGGRHEVEISGRYAAGQDQHIALCQAGSDER